MSTKILEEIYPDLSIDDINAAIEALDLAIEAFNNPPSPFRFNDLACSFKFNDLGLCYFFEMISVNQKTYNIIFSEEIGGNKIYWCTFHFLPQWELWKKHPDKKFLRRDWCINKRKELLKLKEKKK